MNSIFLLFLAAMVLVWLAVVMRYLHSPARTVAIAGIVGWLVYAGCIGYFGVVADRTLIPPGGLLPTLMTFHGANFDIAIGLSAPVVAWLLATKRLAPRWAIAWNIAGILMLANVAVRGVLTTPGPLNVITTEVPNVAVGMFPCTYIPGFMVPLALLLHVLSIRGLPASGKSHAATSAAADADVRSAGHPTRKRGHPGYSP